MLHLIVATMHGRSRHAVVRAVGVLICSTHGVVADRARARRTLRLRTKLPYRYLIFLAALIVGRRTFVKTLSVLRAQLASGRAVGNISAYPCLALVAIVRTSI